MTQGRFDNPIFRVILTYKKNTITDDTRQVWQPSLPSDPYIQNGTITDDTRQVWQPSLHSDPYIKKVQ